jgi:hypothetical protein
VSVLASGFVGVDEQHGIRTKDLMYSDRDRTGLSIVPAQSQQGA